jgi:hypothetical protein
MSKLYIKEYKELRGVDGGLAQIGEEPGTAQAPLSFTTTAQSAVFGDGTKMVRVISDGNCHLAFGKSPVATVNDMLVVASTVEYFGVKQGDKVAAIDAAP